MSWTAILLLAIGSYGFKAVGLLVLGPLAARSDGSGPGLATGTTAGFEAGAEANAGNGAAADRVGSVGGWPIQLGQLLPPALLAALVVNQTVTDGQELVLDARLAGVMAGAVAVWRGGPFWLVILIAAAVTGILRAVAG